MLTWWWIRERVIDRFGSQKACGSYDDFASACVCSFIHKSHAHRSKKTVPRTIHTHSCPIFDVFPTTHSAHMLFLIATAKSQTSLSSFFCNSKIQNQINQIIIVLYWKFLGFGKRTIDMVLHISSLVLKILLCKLVIYVIYVIYWLTVSSVVFQHDIYYDWTHHRKWRQ